MDISRVFTNKSEAVATFFQQPGMGYYIPLYQREYSWDTENIDQLIEDICSGVCDIVDGVDDPIHFMGTLILVTEINPNVNIKPLDPRALPTRIDNVIDGQQRISTIALLGCQLYQKLYQINRQLSNDYCSTSLKEVINFYLKILIEVFSVDLQRGKPERKPIIIRASIDQWTLDGQDNDNYKSDVSSYIASFIRSIHDHQDHVDFPSIPSKSLVGKNIKKINQLLKDVEEAHEVTDPKYPPAWSILSKIRQEDLWIYPRPELVEKVNNRSNPMTSEERRICLLIELLAFCYYLLQRCCFTIIQPVSDVRAFDMFQSLNATGTPLTAFETFKPLVVNFVEISGDRFKDSNSAKYLEPADKLLSSMKSASAKNKLTNEFLTLFALTNDGSKLSKQFSAQRGWLNLGYEKICLSIEAKEEFVRRMGDIATYWNKVIKLDPQTSPCIPGIENIPSPDKELAVFCFLYLQKANHKMANTILSLFYAQIVRSVQGADREFVSVCKIVAAFFTIWRSALPNTGLDEIYRKIMKDHLSWQKGNTELTSQFLSTYFKNVFVQKGIGNKTEWIDKAKDYLRYGEAQAICRFALFITAADTIPDSDSLGLMKVGNLGSTPQYLTPERWISDELKSVEHIAPQNPELQQNWDSQLYQNDNYQCIGNLTLLPVRINSSLGNKGWVGKFIYYQHLSETDPDKLEELNLKAQEQGIILNPSTIDSLKKTPTTQHITPIVNLGIDGVWDKKLVDSRSYRICEILWDRIYSWLT